MPPRYDDDSSDDLIDDELDDGGMSQMNVMGGQFGNLCCPLCMLIAIMVVFTQVGKDSCSRPLGPFLTGCGVVYFITVLAACCGIGSAHPKANRIANIASVLNGFTGCFMVIWLILGIYWLTNTEKEPTNGILSSATEFAGAGVGAATGTLGNAANTATNTIGAGNVVNQVTNAPVPITPSLASRGLCNKHLYNMSLVIIILSFLWCPCLLLAMVCMLWNNVRSMIQSKKGGSDREVYSSDSNY